MTPRPGTEIGLGYRSFIDHELDSTLETPNAGNFDVNYDDVNMPDIVTLGIRQMITDRFRFMAGVEWDQLEPIRDREGRGRSGTDRSAFRTTTTAGSSRSAASST